MFNISGDYKGIFENAGFEEFREYRYWSDMTLSMNFDGLIEDLWNAPRQAVVILQTCGHNPTGCDPTMDQWKQIAEVIKRRRLFPFFHSNYQGLASGDVDQDAWPVRYFVNEGIELFCAQSFGKNFEFGSKYQTTTSTSFLDYT